MDAVSFSECSPVQENSCDAARRDEACIDLFDFAAKLRPRHRGAEPMLRWDEVCEAWNIRHPENRISAQRVQQIASRAHLRLRRRLRQLCKERSFPEDALGPTQR